MILPAAPVARCRFAAAAQRRLDVQLSRDQRYYPRHRTTDRRRQPQPSIDAPHLNGEDHDAAWRRPQQSRFIQDVEQM